MTEQFVNSIAFAQCCEMMDEFVDGAVEDVVEAVVLVGETISGASGGAPPAGVLILGRSRS